MELQFRFQRHLFDFLKRKNWIFFRNYWKRKFKKKSFKPIALLKIIATWNCFGFSSDNWIEGIPWFFQQWCDNSRISSNFSNRTERNRRKDFKIFWALDSWNFFFPRFSESKQRKVIPILLQVVFGVEISFFASKFGSTILNLKWLIEQKGSVVSSKEMWSPMFFIVFPARLSEIQAVQFQSTVHYSD